MSTQGKVAALMEAAQAAAIALEQSPHPDARRRYKLLCLALAALSPEEVRLADGAAELAERVIELVQWDMARKLATNKAATAHLSGVVERARATLIKAGR